MLCPSANVPFWEDAKKPLCKGNLIRPVNVIPTLHNYCPYSQNSGTHVIPRITAKLKVVNGS
ncbi:hypothetical protein T09_15536 [Trichinella sp. T9]|nr:hypothetical protein T09_15536 [Trichinella sp. T9]